jgi:pimeloyl-ACP methyl ester carboxylesterase
MSDFRMGEVRANGLRFATLEAGDGPLVLCLHGFPDTAHTWRHLLPALAEAGFRAVAPWLRGYAPTDVPQDGDYRISTLAEDANALHEALGGDGDARLVGHDGGAMTAYAAGAAAPERWHRVAALAVPPPAVAGTAFFDYRQLRRSFYVFLFQTPLAELVVPADDLAFVANLWRDWSPSYDGTEDRVEVRRSLASPGNVAAAIGYYRAMFSGPVPSESPPQPTLYLHGDEDGAFGIDRIAGSADALAPGSHVDVVTGTGHFLHLERPDDVNARIVDWLAR